MTRVVVASYNVHGGVDGWGRPFDVVAACRRVDADVLTLQESWCPDDGVSMAQTVARQLGYEAVELSFARGRIVAPPDVASDVASDRWGPHLWARSLHGMRLDRRQVESPRQRDRDRARSARRPAQRGAWGIAVLSRLPVQGSQTVDLGKLPTDPSRRGAIVVDVELPGTGLPLPRGGYPPRPSQPRVAVAHQRLAPGPARPHPGAVGTGRRHELVGTTPRHVVPGLGSRRERSHVARMVVAAFGAERSHPREKVGARRNGRDPAHRRF